MGSCYALFPAAIADTAVVRKLLTQEYKRRAEFSPLLWSKAMKLHLDEVYTRLKIVSRPKRIVHPASLEIDLCNIFGCKGENSMALAEGSPGIGKTTLCLKLAYDWANESMPSTFPIFELVLLLKCRDLDGDIMEAISEQLLPDDIAVKTKEGLLNFITDLVNQERILIILDGLDELPEKSQYHVSKLLKRSILPFCYVLTTTRQEKGIEARKQFAFDICVQIEGFTEEDSFEYIRKHFKNIDPSKGERLIEQTKENTLLHALQNNPLNLLLLCVVYEDHEGKLPSSRTDLYQIIVRCLLRRYCEKNSVKACEEDTDLEKQFEENILVLGELAWECLLNDRHSFREDELKEFERRDDKLVVRYLGLVFKEESLKRLKPNHEYFFLHKSFQEYMAALYITHKLRRNQFDVFEYLSFNDLVVRFPQVFLFVCGILRGEASILFTQIGEELESDWEWLECTRSEANFFVDGFSESGNSELMADVLFSFIPFPWVLQLTFDANDESDDLSDRNVARLLSDCAGFSKLHTPAEVHLRMEMSLDSTVLRDLASLPNLKSLSLAGEKNSIFRKPEFFQAISNFTSLSELTLPSSVEWDIAAEYLTTNKTLEKVTFALVDESDEGWAKALDAGLCADTPLSSVGVRIHGSLSPTALQALENLLFNKSLSSLSIYVCGDMQDSLSVVLARCFAGQIAVKVVDLCVNGKLSLFGANFIERGIVENNFLSKLNVSLRGEVPDNWLAVGRNLHSRLGEKTASFALFPNTFGIVTASPVTQCCAFETKDGLLVEQNVTLIVWGELGGDGAEGLFEALSHSPVSHLTLDIHGKLTDGILNVTERWVDKRKTLSSLTINTWEQLTNEEKTLFKELKLDKNPAVTLNVHDFPAPHEESLENKFVSIDDLESFFALFKEAKNTGQQNLSARIGIEMGDGDDDDDVQYINFSRELEDDVHQVFASNTTLNDLSLTFSNANNMSYSWALLLKDGLARNTSLRNLTLTINFYNHERWDACSYIGRLCERNTSLKNLSLIIEIHGYQELDLVSILEFYISVENLSLTANIYSGGLFIDLADYVGYSFAHDKALKNLTLTFNNFGKLRLAWTNWPVDTGLEKSLNDFSLTINNYGAISYLSYIPGRLRQLKSLTTFNLTLNSCGKQDEDLLYGVLEEAMTSESLETLRFKVNDPQISSGYDLSEFVVMSPSLSLIELTFSLYGGEESSRE